MINLTWFELWFDFFGPLQFISFALSGKVKITEISCLCYRMSYIFCSNCQITIVTSLLV